MSEEKVKAVEAEVQRLNDAKVIREVLYPVCLANTVPVKKKNEKWRMCVDFTDLNKACKKDDFPLERVDKIVDEDANSEMLLLLDMFSSPGWCPSLLCSSAADDELIDAWLSTPGAINSLNGG
jgi:hypothetical protein